jgi:multisubunit Na+/H+ antiporter MnhB subunit
MNDNQMTPMTITRGDIEAKARQIERAVNQTTETVRGRAIAIGVGVGVLLLLLFLLNRRNRHRQAVVEVYRV